MKIKYRKQAFYNRVIKMREEHPELTLEDIGKKYGITRQRVSQILKEKRG